jgi:hypothetical protein
VKLKSGDALQADLVVTGIGVQLRLELAKVPHGHWQTMTFLAALRHDRVTAPWLIDDRSMAKPSKSTSRRF